MYPDTREPIPLGYGRPIARRRRRWMRALSLAFLIVPMLAMGFAVGRWVAAVR
jgi:hypothetical protein